MTTTEKFISLTGKRLPVTLKAPGTDDYYDVLDLLDDPHNPQKAYWLLTRNGEHFTGWVREWPRYSVSIMKNIDPTKPFSI